MERYDPAFGTLGTWELMPPMVDCRHGFVAVTIGGAILVCGGDAHRAGEHQGTMRSAECFCPARSAWAQVQPMLAPRSGHAGASLDGALCVCGGSSGQEVFSSAERLSPTDGAWVPLPPMSARRVHALAAVVAG